MTGDVIRARFLEFFAQHGHLVQPSAKLRPDDPTTHFTTAGMQPFVPYFLGNEVPPSRRMATCQKCLRADDLDEVGYTARHLSFFEMLGNFSFGDYFKREAIAWAWSFVLEGLELDPELLWVSVYEKDDEAAAIWRDHVGVRPERIVRFGMADNWWGPVGNSGPCGPCSEIFLDRGSDWGEAADPTEDEGGDRYVELWNLVFQQYNATCSKKELMANGVVPELLPAPGIDTGAGLERIAAAMQGVSTVFETDLLRPLCDAVVAASQAAGATTTYGQESQTTAAINRVADHVRALTFAISDGIFPSNKAGGYVLRQILRRAARFGRLRLGLTKPFLHALVPAVVDRYAETYPELRASQATVEATVRAEEERFSETLSHGLPRLEDELAETKDRLAGERAFYLYETFGVPIEMQVEVAAEQGKSVDAEAFERLRTSREKAAIAAGFSGHGDFGDDLLADLPATLFQGYDFLGFPAEVRAIVQDPDLDATRGLVTGGRLVTEAVPGSNYALVLSTTPFYAEGGGQVGDQGALEGDEGTFLVTDTRRDRVGRYLHFGHVAPDQRLSLNEEVFTSVEYERRQPTARAHTATHLLHAALRQRLGDHVAQAGSLVEPDRLRFDFSHYAAVTPDDLQAIEEAANQAVLADYKVDWETVDIEQAREAGALMFFGDKYGQRVRLVTIEEDSDWVEEPEVYSRELCGGTHVQRTGNIGSVRIISESSIGSGIRRIEAVTGQAALAYAREQEAALRAVAGELRAPVSEVRERTVALQARIRDLERQLGAVQAARSAGQADELLTQASEIGGIRVVATVVQAADADNLKALADEVTEKLADGVVLLGAAIDGKVLVVAKASDAAVAAGAHAGNAVKAAAQAAGGGGGGRPQFAQAGGRDAAKLNEAIAAGLAALGQQLA